MTEAIQAASIYILASLKDEVTGELKRVKGEVNDLTGNFRKGIGALGDFGSSLSALVAPLGLIGGIGVSTAAGFDQSMATISARAGLVGADLDKVRQFVLKMGAQFPLSSTEAADAMGELLASGQTAEEAMSTLPAVLIAATASGETLGSVTNVVTGILGAFGLEASDAASIVDTLSAAAAVSKANIGELGAGFDNVGAIASQFGLSVKDTAAALAILNNANIGGAEGGTALKSLLTHLDSTKGQKQLKDLGTSLYYTNAQIKDIVKNNKILAREGKTLIPVPELGDIRPFGVVIGEINQALDKMSDKDRNEAMQNLGGAYGKVALSALLMGDSIADVEALMDKQASASAVSEARMSSFKGVITNLQGSVEALMINAFTPFMNDVLAPLATQVNDVVLKINDWVQANPELVKQIVGVGAALLLIGGGAIGVAFAVDKLTSLGTAFMALAEVLAPVILPLVIIGGLVAAYITNFAGFRDAVNDLATAFNNLDAPSKLIIVGLGAIGLVAAGITLPVGGAATAMWGLVTSVAAFAAPLLLIGGLIYAYLTNLGGFRDWIDDIGNSFRNLDPLAKAIAVTLGLVAFGFVALNTSLVGGMLATWITNVGIALAASFAEGGIVAMASTVITGLAGSFSAMILPLAPLAASMWALAAPFLFVAGIIGLVAGLIYAYLTNLGGFKDFIDGIGNWLRTELPKGWEAAGKAIGGFLDSIRNALIAFKDSIIRSLIAPMKPLFDAVLKWAQSIGDTILAKQMQNMIYEIDRVNGVGGHYHAENSGLSELSSGTGKANGGKPNGITRVGENDNPELLKQGGSTYLIPGDHGALFPRQGETKNYKRIGDLTMPEVHTPNDLLKALGKIAARAV